MADVSMQPVSRILIANRSEIARRIIHSAVIAFSLSACCNNKIEGTKDTKEFGTWRM